MCVQFRCSDIFFFFFFFFTSTDILDVQVIEGEKKGGGAGE